MCTRRAFCGPGWPRRADIRPATSPAARRARRVRVSDALGLGPHHGLPERSREIRLRQPGGWRLPTHNKTKRAAGDTARAREGRSWSDLSRKGVFSHCRSGDWASRAPPPSSLGYIALNDSVGSAHRPRRRRIYLCTSQTRRWPCTVGTEGLRGLMSQHVRMTLPLFGNGLQLVCGILGNRR